jgi:hypothetical protein
VQNTKLEFSLTTKILNTSSSHKNSIRDKHVGQEDWQTLTIMLKHCPGKVIGKADALSQRVNHKDG